MSNEIRYSPVSPEDLDEIYEHIAVELSSLHRREIDD